MDGKGRWFGWVAIGLGAVALLVALLGRGFGPPIGAAGRPGANVPQQNVVPQNGPAANAQPGAGRQDVGPQGGPAGPGGQARRGAGRQADGGFGLGGWLHFPFKLIGGSFQWGMLALLIGLGVWMMRGRNNGATSTSGRAEPAQGPPSAPLSPTGEAYTDEPAIASKLLGSGVRSGMPSRTPLAICCPAATNQ
jgi:hypothetical protein